MRKSIHYNNDEKKKKKKKNFYINYLSNTKHISNFSEAQITSSCLLMANG